MGSECLSIGKRSSQLIRPPQKSTVHWIPTTRVIDARGCRTQKQNDQVVISKRTKSHEIADITENTFNCFTQIMPTQHMFLKLIKV
jgi:hypothetical protein